MSNNRIESQTSCAYTLEQTEITEPKNKHLLELARAFLVETNVPKSYWLDSVLTTTFLINKMPFKVLEGKKSGASFVSTCSIFPVPSKVFECTCFVRI